MAGLLLRAIHAGSKYDPGMRIPQMIILRSRKGEICYVLKREHHFSGGKMSGPVSLGEEDQA
jgi:hypothetical protein